MTLFMTVSIKLFIETLSHVIFQALARFALTAADPVHCLEEYRTKTHHLEAVQAMIQGLEGSFDNALLVSSFSFVVTAMSLTVYFCYDVQLRTCLETTAGKPLDLVIRTVSSSSTVPRPISEQQQVLIERHN